MKRSSSSSDDGERDSARPKDDVPAAGASVDDLVEDGECDGAVALATVILYLEENGCRRRGRMGPVGFDMLGPDGRVLVYGFNPDAVTDDLRQRARVLLAAFRAFSRR
jgi:hypothetical protein